MPKQEPQPDDIVMSRRKAGYGTVSSPHGLWEEGGLIPMRYEEACAREDCEPVRRDVLDAPAPTTEEAS